MEFLGDYAGSEGRNLGCGGHPAGEVGFERGLIVIAGPLGLAGNFLHYVAAERGGEEGLTAGKEAGDLSMPFVCAVGLKVIISGDRDKFYTRILT